MKSSPKASLFVVLLAVWNTGWCSSLEQDGACIDAESNTVDETSTGETASSCEASPSIVEATSTNDPKITTVSIGEDPFTSPVMIIENFLDETLLDSIVKTLKDRPMSDWRPVIPHHARFYDKFDLNEDKVLKAVPENEGGYPGLRTDLIDAYGAAVRERLTSFDLNKVFTALHRRLDVEWSPTDSYFGNLCYHPDSLSHTQRLPHIDIGIVGSKKVPIQLAILHYINPDF